MHQEVATHGARVLHQHIGPMVVVVTRPTGDLGDLVLAEAAHIGLVAPIFGSIILGAHIAAAAPVLVAHPPELDAPGLRTAIATAQIGHRAGAVEGEILHPLLHLLHRAAADIAANI